MKNPADPYRLMGVLALVMMTIGHVVFAQPVVSPAEKVKKSLKVHFENATSVTWSKYNPLHYATFSYNDESWIAFIDSDGKLVTSGRRISTNQLPIVVQRRLHTLLDTYEKKFGALKSGCIYEMVKSDATEYFIPFENDHHYVTFISRSDGDLVVAAKGKKSPPLEIQKNIMAKK